MDDLISKQAAIDLIRETPPALYSAYQHCTYVDKRRLMIRLMALPSVQPDRKKGKWIEKGRKPRCSECGNVDFLKPNYCPNCGADMREEAE